MTNPLIAEKKSSTEAYSGIPLVESAMDLKKGIESGDWASVALGAVGTALDALGMAMDPFGAILAAGVGWLMEHVGPLKEALDGLAGDPDQVKANSETFKNVATELGSIGADLTTMVNNDIVSWTGVAADAYRERSKDTVALLTAAQQGADGASSGIKTAGEVVAAVRSLVRDIIAELVGHLISWALQVVFTLGIGLAWVVPQVIGEVAKVASKLADLVKKLVQALKALSPLLKKLGDIFDDAAKALKNVKGGKSAPPPKADAIPGGPKDPGATPKGGDGSTTPSGAGGKGDGSTTPSGAKGDTDTPPPPKTDPPPTPKPDGSTTPSGSGGGGGTPKADPPPPPKTDPPPAPKPDGSTTPSGSPNKPSPPRDRAVGPDDRVCKSDPIDIATGDMVLVAKDLELPLALERTHISSYRAGQWFGPSWTSTLDQRLEIDFESVCFIGSDGTILVYPLAETGVLVLPVEGPRLPLIREQDGGYSIVDSLGDKNFRFGPLPGRGGEVMPLLAIDGHDGSRVDIDYDTFGAPRLMRHSSGYQVEVRAEGGRITGLRVLDPARDFGVQAMRYGYDPQGRLTQVIDSSGVPQVFDYDGDGRVAGWQDRNGVWYRYIYDLDGRCVRTVGDQGYLDGAFEYDREALITRYTDSIGNTTEYHLNEANQLLREVDPLGGVTLSTWDRYDRLLARTDALGRTTRYEYSEEGVLEAVIEPDGSRREVLLDAAEDGTLEEVKSESELDLFGRPQTAIDAAGRRTGLSWTVEGKLLSRAHPSGPRELWRYDVEGNEIEHVGLLGQVSRFEYGPFNLVLAKIDPTGARTTYEYDTELRQIAETNPNGRTWRHVYDPAGRVIEEVDFDGRVTRFTYDAAGQLIRSVNGAGEVVEYRYDLLGNVAERSTSTETSTFVHNAAGRVVSAVKGEVRLRADRDDEGRVIAHGVTGNIVEFTYDEQDRWKRRRTPSGVDSQWSYDDEGNPVALDIGGHTLRFAHDPSGAEIERRVDDNLVVRQAFDPDKRLASQVVTTDVVVSKRRYGYRSDGRLIGVEDVVTGTTRFELDAADRVTDVIAPDRAENYRYDAAGSITFAAGSGQDGERRYDGTMLVGSGTDEYVYDAQGRLIRRQTRDSGAWLYTWDPLDRLVMVTTPDGTAWRYLYDPLGRRIAKQRLDSDGTVAEQVEFVWDGTTIVEESHTGAGIEKLVVTWEFHPHENRPVVQYEQRGGERRFHTIVTDQIGTPVELFDEAGARTWRSQATLWGKEKSADGTPLRFPGQYEDAETGLHYNVFRYYDPATGRYISQDPLGLEPAPDPMAYVGNPHSASDPLGLAPSASSPCGAGGSGANKRKHPDSDGASGTGSTKKPKNERPVKQGGGTTSGEHVLKDGKPPYGSGPKADECTDVNALNKASELKPGKDGWSENQLSDALGKKLEDAGLPIDQKWIKGHLQNDNLGGQGVSSNLTPLTSQANKNMSGGFEGPLKKSADAIPAIKNSTPSDTALLKRYTPDEVADIRKGFDQLQVRYEVKTSSDLKFPDSSNPFERSIRDHLEFNAKYEGMTPGLEKYLTDTGKINQLPKLPPVGTTMDTISGKFTYP